MSNFIALLEFAEPEPSTPGRPLLEKLKARAHIDWGQAPKYNEEYRKIRWPGQTSVTSYFRPLTPVDVEARRNGRRTWDLGLESSIMPGYVEVSDTDEGITETRRFRRSPIWKSTMANQMSLKADGRWTRKIARNNIKFDIELCMRENIPFKTKTFEYKPSDNWLYVNGLRALKFDLVTGYIAHFTFSGVYNKVVSLTLRMFDINVKLQRRKLKWINDNRVRPGARNPITAVAAEVDIDLNKVYTFSDFFQGAPLYRGFSKVSHQLFSEFTRFEQRNDGSEIQP